MNNKIGGGINFILRKPVIILYAVASIFTILFSYYSILKAYNFQAYAWDLGLYSQVFYSVLKGKFFYTSLLGSSYLAEHFSPFIFLIEIPFYFFPSEYTLLIIQSIFLSFSIIPLYYITDEILTRLENGSKNKRIKCSTLKFISFIMPVAFILSPLTESPVYFDFHLMVFIPFFYFMALYYLLKAKRILYYIFLALIISLHSNFIFIAMMIILMEIILNKRGIVTRPRKLSNGMYFGISFAVLFSYYILAGFLKSYIGHIPEATYLIIGGSGSVSRSLTGFLTVLFYNPEKIISVLVANYDIKILFLILGFLAVDFLFIEYPAGLLPALPYFAYAMLSTYIPYYFIGFQYSMMFIPFVFIAGIFGIYVILEKIDISPNFKKIKKYFKNSMLVIVLFSIIGFAILSPLSPASMEPANIGYFSGNNKNINVAKINFMHEIKGIINNNSSLITGNNIFPEFYKNYNATAFPDATISEKVPYYKYLIADFSDSQTYVKNSQNISLAELAQEYISSGLYGILAEGYGIMVLKLNYTGSPELYVPSNNNYSYNYFQTVNGISEGPFINKNTSYFGKLDDNALNIYDSNKTYLLPGNYNITFTLNSTVEKNTTFTIKFNSGKCVVLNKTVNNDLNQDYITFSINVKNFYSNVIYTAYLKNQDVNIKNIKITQLNA
ncbi:DUF2079 domain-containing protein [Acidiplasma sp.]|uniref:DUF2079 domain-containing protein n=1 Tax=Acidiplasma sp. TaxID=1872114 RepID=UPI00258CD50F|nr:DUF2079 domain-containing protein [Acidiplasma sp.]